MKDEGGGQEFLPGGMEGGGRTASASATVAGGEDGGGPGFGLPPRCHVRPISAVTCGGEGGLRARPRATPDHAGPEAPSGGHLAEGPRNCRLDK